MEWENRKKKKYWEGMREKKRNVWNHFYNWWVSVTKYIICLDMVTRLVSTIYTSLLKCLRCCTSDLTNVSMIWYKNYTHTGMKKHSVQIVYTICYFKFASFRVFLLCLFNVLFLTHSHQIHCLFSSIARIDWEKIK